MLKIVASLVVILLSLSSPVLAADANDAPMRTSITIGGVVSLVGGDDPVQNQAQEAIPGDTSILPVAFLDVDSPVRLSDAPAMFRVFGTLGVSNEPEKTVNILDLKTYKAAVFEFGAYKYLGGVPGVRVVVSGGWSSKLPSSPDPIRTVVKHYGAGFGFGGLDDANITFIFGRDEAAANMFGRGQLMVHGSVPVKGTNEALWIYGDATMNVSHDPLDPRSRDIFRAGIVTDIGRAIEELRK